MARILWLNWSGGGNLPPSLGIARVLTDRGHKVAFAGRPEMVPRVEAAGFRAIELTQAYAQGRSSFARAAAHPPRPAISPRRLSRTRFKTSSPRRRRTLSSRRDVPRCACACRRIRPAFSASLSIRCFVSSTCGGGSSACSTACASSSGFADLPPLDALWQPRDKIIISTSLAAFDAAPLFPAGKWCSTLVPCSRTKEWQFLRGCPGPQTTRRTGHGQLQHHVSSNATVEKMQRTLDAPRRAFRSMSSRPQPALSAPSELAGFRVLDNAVALGLRSARSDHATHRSGDYP